MALSEKQVAVIKGMLARGDRQHHIAAYFDVNSGRIAEINTGQKWAEVVVDCGPLPPSGPYLLIPKNGGSFTDLLRELNRREELKDGE